MNTFPADLQTLPADQAINCILDYEKIPLSERFPIETTYELIRKAGREFKDKPALAQLYTGLKDEEPVEISSLEFAQQVTRTANLLSAAGVKRDDAVTLLLPTLMENQMVLWGSQAVGIANPINYFLEPDNIIEIMNSVKTKVLLTLAPDDSLGIDKKVARIIDSVPTLTHIFVVKETPDHEINLKPFSTRGHTVLDFLTALKEQPHDELTVKEKIKGSDLAIYFHTGGTTGRPKIARLCHSSVAFVAQVYADFNHCHGDSPAMNSLPLFHVFGTIAGSLAVIIQGRCVILMTATGFRNPNVVANWWYFVSKFKIAWFPTVPTILNALLNVSLEGCDLSNLKYINSGSAHLPVPLKNKCSKKFEAQVASGYGMTESSCLIARCIPGYETPEDTVGLRIPYTQIIVAHTSEGKITKICDPGETGVVLAKGPNIFKGYLDPVEDKKAWVEDGWLDTGDIGLLDKDGYLTLTGRAKDLIIRGGHNIDPQIIETPLAEHPDVAQAVAIGQPDAYAGEIPVAYVTLKQGAEAQENELLEYCTKKIPERSAIPKRIEILDDFPLTAVGKISRPELRNFATEYAVNQILAKENIHADIEAFQTPAKGQQVCISLVSKKDEKAAKHLLTGIPVVFEFQ